MIGLGAWAGLAARPTLLLGGGFCWRLEDGEAWVCGYCSCWGVLAGVVGGEVGVVVEVDLGVARVVG